MSLFKYNMLSIYNIKDYNGELLRLQCPQTTKVKAPFDGKVKQDDNGYVIEKGKYLLRLNHINVMDADKECLGTPLTGRIGNMETAYVEMALYKNGQLQDMGLYLHRLDEDEPEVQIVEEPKKVSTPKKATNKK